MWKSPHREDFVSSLPYSGDPDAKFGRRLKTAPFARQVYAKTGYIVGATPRSQQLGFVIGVVTSSFVVAITLFMLDRTYRGPNELHGIGGPQLPAPQATLMATIIKGLLAQNLPWAPVLVGVFLAFMAQMAGAHALSWAVGAYLPVSTTAPIWIGGMLKSFVDSWRRKKEGVAGEESELSSGMLYSTGLVAGGSLGGVLIALVAFIGDYFGLAISGGNIYALFVSTHYPSNVTADGGGPVGRNRRVGRRFRGCHRGGLRRRARRWNRCAREAPGQAPWSRCRRSEAAWSGSRSA